MKYVRCQICNSANHVTLFKTRDYDSDGKVWFNIVKCSSCGLVSTIPQPKKNFLSQFYVFNYYGNQSFFYKIFLLINDFIIRNKAVYILKKKKGRILDIGCGDGDFLKYMKDHGWLVYGVETSKSGADLAKQKSIKNIYNSDLKKARFQNEFFDVVTLWHVLEHIDKPTELMQEVRRIMKNDGSLIIAVPNVDSIQSKIGRSKWFHLDVPRHLYHFSTETLSNLLEKNGFKIEKIKHFSFVYNLIGVIQTMQNMLGIKFNFLHHLIKRVDREKSYINASFIYNFLLTFVSGLVLFIPAVILSLTESSIGRGATITIYAKKVF